MLAGPLRRDVGETIQAALLFADLRGFTALSESNPPAAVISALDAWFDRIAGSVHAFGGEVLKFIGDGVLAIFPVVGGSPRSACDAALRAVSAARAGMAHLDEARRRQGLPPLPFGVALHLGEMLWGNIGAADRLDFTAIGPAVNLVSRLEGLCRPLDKTVLISGAFAAETDDAADPARNACAARHRLALRRLHRAGELSRTMGTIMVEWVGTRATASSQRMSENCLLCAAYFLRLELGAHGEHRDRPAHLNQGESSRCRPAADAADDQIATQTIDCGWRRT